MAGWEITNSCGAETSVKVTGPLSTKSVVPWLWMVKVLMIGVPITVEPKDVPSAVEGVVSLSIMVIAFPDTLISGPAITVQKASTLSINALFAVVSIFKVEPAGTPTKFADTVSKAPAITAE